MDFYKTIAALSEGCVTEQRSKFISFAVPVQTTGEVKEIVAGYRKQYYDARHVCWAYRLGADCRLFRVNDDGEPSSTAGKPILGVIRSHELTDILVVVVRYFGGVKLGVSGLIAAYRAAAQAAIEKAALIEKMKGESVSFTFDYASLNGIMRIIKEENIEIISRKMEAEGEMTLLIRASEVENVKSRLSKWVNGFVPCKNN
ncbi:MAG: YigZ family protein [Candidatus Azobacteroides sp.]|nr:YigZ family protein [Candidatus Azobacteroides sp.]